MRTLMTRRICPICGEGFVLTVDQEDWPHRIPGFVDAAGKTHTRGERGILVDRWSCRKKGEEAWRAYKEFSTYRRKNIYKLAGCQPVRIVTGVEYHIED